MAEPWQGRDKTIWWCQCHVLSLPLKLIQVSFFNRKGMTCFTHEVLAIIALNIKDKGTKPNNLKTEKAARLAETRLRIENYGKEFLNRRTRFTTILDAFSHYHHCLATCVCLPCAFLGKTEFETRSATIPSCMYLRTWRGLQSFRASTYSTFNGTGTTPARYP